MSLLTAPRLLRDALADPRRRWPLLGSLVVLLGVLGVATATILLSDPPRTAAASPMPSPTETIPASPTAPPQATPTITPSPTPSPTPDPGIYEDLSGVATTEELAHRYPIAVMLDDHPDARPQSGLAAASVVWQAPVEGGIPRYMAVFQSGTPPEIGPVRSARLFFVRWAAEWKALYLHVGGPAPLRAFLNGRQGLVINADGKKSYRVGFRAAPHNVYTTGERLLRLAAERGATADSLAYDPAAPGALQPFRDAVAEGERGPDGAQITVSYRTERIDYRYERATNRWLRSVDGKPQHDPEDRDTRSRATASGGPEIAPTTVIVMRVAYGISNNVNGPSLGRVTAQVLGRGTAWIFVEGRVINGTWTKPKPEARTRFLDTDGKEIVLPRGQIFVQVIPQPSALKTDL